MFVIDSEGLWRVCDVFGQRLQKSKLCADAGVLDQTMMVRVLKFYTQVAQFLLRAADPKHQG